MRRMRRMRRISESCECEAVTQHFSVSDPLTASGINIFYILLHHDSTNALLRTFGFVTDKPCSSFRSEILVSQTNGSENCPRWCINGQ